MTRRRPRRPWWRHLSPGTRALLARLVLLGIALVCFARGQFMGVGLAALLACLIAPEPPP